MTIRLHRRFIPSAISYAILSALALFFLIPFAWLILSSINTSAGYMVLPCG